MSLKIYKYPSQCLETVSTQFDFDNDAICDELEIFGCTDPQADNFDSESTQEDGSCFYLEIY